MKKITLLFISFLILSTLAVYLRYTIYQDEKSTYTDNKVDELDVSYQVINSTYGKISELIFDNHINKPEILEIFQHATSANQDIKRRTRAELFKKLNWSYQNMRKRNIRQLHFHLPNGESFLRFHKPGKFGDNLKDVRFSVMKANREKVPVTGFEEGRIKNGFRYVFPLSYKNRHLGSVEVSISFEAMRSRLEGLFHKQYLFLIKQSVVDEKVFQSEKSFYETSPISSSYLVESNTMFTKNQDLIHQIIFGKLDDSLNENRKFVEPVRFDNKNYLIVFLPVKNIQGHYVAYIASYLEDDYMHECFMEFIRSSILIILFMVITGFSFFIIIINNEKLQRAKQEAVQSNEIKSAFLANMSHEIRTPMNGILGMTRLVLDSNVGDKEKRMLNDILHSAESLMEIINDILDFSKIEAGKLNLDRQTFNLELSIDKLLSNLVFQAREKDIDLIGHFDFTQIPSIIIGDELRIRQILFNLIGNAIKFTDSGSVTLEIHLEEQTEKQVTLNFSVIDTGIGIPENKLEAIFDSFSQADNSTTRKFGGTGLGLAICKRIIEMKGGELGVESEEGRGSRFFFTLTFDIGNEKDLIYSDSVETIDYSLEASLHILLVEDNRINQKIAKSVLEKASQQVTLAANGLEALQLIAANSFDIVLMDMQMPVMDGITATRIIRASETEQPIATEIEPELITQLREHLKGKQIPIIALTANVLEKDKLLCEAAGMNGFLTKPFKAEDLFVILKGVIPAESHFDTTDKLEAETPGLEPGEFLKQEYQLDDDTIHTILKAANETLAKELIRLQQAIEANDQDTIVLIAHTFKGFFQNLGNKKLAAEAAVIEETTGMKPELLKTKCNAFIHNIEVFHSTILKMH